MDLFAGLRPQIAAYVPFFNARLSMDIGVGSLGRWAVFEDEAFPALPDVESAVHGRIIGDCNICHDVELIAYQAVRDFVFFCRDG